MEHRREAVAGLVLSVIAIAATGVIAVQDPFDTDKPWINWVVCCVFCLVAISTSVGIACEVDDDEDFFAFHAGILVSFLMLGGFIGWMISSGLGAPFRSVLWGAFAAGIIAFILAGFVTYIAATTRG